MSIPYLQSTLADVRAVEGTYIQYPFLADGDTDTKVYVMQCSQLESDYNSSQISLDATMSSASAAGVITLPFDADNEAYYVGDTGHSPISGGMISFTRTFSNIPKSITNASGSQFVSFPGIDRGSLGLEAVTNLANVSGIVYETVVNHGLVAGDQVQILSLYAKGFDSNGTLVDTLGSFGDNSEEYTVQEVVSTDKIRIGTDVLSQTLTWEVYSGTIKRVDFPELPEITQISMTNGTPGITLSFATAHGISSGIDIDLILSFTIGSENFIHTYSGSYLVLSTTSTSLLVDVGHVFSSQVSLTFVTGVAKMLDFSRLPISSNVATQTRYDYILPGVTSGISSALDVVIPKTFQVRARAGSSNDTVMDSKWEQYGLTIRVYFPTYPTRSQYIEMINDKHHIVIESSLQQWAGNILVMQTKTCKAQ